MNTASNYLHEKKADFDYNFRVLGTEELPSDGSKNLRKFAHRNLIKFQEIAAVWDARKKAEWLLREYLALKCILAASLQLASAAHARTHNLQMAVPYLLYYGIFNAGRSLVYMSPFYDWKGNGETSSGSVSISHDRVFSSVSVELNCLTLSSSRDSLLRIFTTARKSRELSSYRFPLFSHQDDESPGVSRNDAEHLATLLSEIAVFNSALLSGQFSAETSIEVADLSDIELQEIWRDAWMNLVGGRSDTEEIMSYDDLRLLDRANRRFRTPVPLPWLIGEGGIDDFFGSYVSDTENEFAFDPDEHHHRLIDVV